MSILETLKEIPVNDETALIAAFAATAGYFFRGFFGFVELPFTRRERHAAAAVNEASAMEIMASQVVESNKQVLVSNQHTVVLTQTITNLIEKGDAEREMFRKRDQERDQQHTAQIKALEKSLIESQEALKDTQERVTNLSEIVQKISIENEGKDRTIATHQRTIDDLNGRILKLEHDNKKAHQQLVERDNEITRLKARVAELESKQPPTAIEATVTIVEPTIDADTQAVREILADLRKEPATTTPEPGKDGQSATLPALPGDTAESVPLDSAGDGV